MPSGYIAKRSDGTCQTAYKEAPPNSPAAALMQDVHISNPVGRNGIKQGPDVVTIQRALKRVPPNFGGAPDIVDDGIVGPITLGAIEKFQALHLGSDKADGTVDVKHRTQAKLSSYQPPKLARMNTTVGFLQSAQNCMHAALNQLAQCTSDSPEGQAALKMVDAHFSIRQEADFHGALRFIKSMYRDMESVFARTGVFGNTGWSMFFEAEPYTNPDLFAFTWFNGFREMGIYGGVLDDHGRDQKWFRHDTIYLSGFYDVTTSDDKIQTIVHELAHFVGPASGANERVTDYAYGDVTSANMIALTSFKKIHNAECYGNFAFEAQFGRQPLHKT